MTHIYVCKKAKHFSVLNEAVHAPIHNVHIVNNAKNKNSIFISHAFIHIAAWQTGEASPGVMKTSWL